MIRTSVGFASAGILCAFFVLVTTQAATLLGVTDLITTSRPSVDASHTVEFTVVQTIPPSGSIVITPTAGGITIPASFDYTDVDLAVSSGGPFIDRALAAVATGALDGVAVVSGTSGSITITLNSSQNISAGSEVRIILGSLASYGEVGDVALVNPSANGSYHMRFLTRDASNATLDEGSTLIAIVSPVTISALATAQPPERSEGLPSGTIAAGNDTIEITLRTNEESTCRYATTTGVLYDNMPGSFGSVGQLFFYTVISNHQNDTTYTYSVRCSDLGGNENTDDYDITFTLEPNPESDTSIPRSGGGGSGSGSIVYGSTRLFLSTVILTGSTSPQATITTLKDGKQFSMSQANARGGFSVVVPDLERGTYTFSVTSRDRSGRTTPAVTSSMTLSQGTLNTISNITIPPTIGLSATTLEGDTPVVVSGEGIPSAIVELSTAPLKGVGTKVFTATTSATGAWEISLDSSDLSRGTHTLKARVKPVGRAPSAYSKSLTLGVGEAPSGAVDFSKRADINDDGKINLVDFSILLTAWETDNADADINQDGIVNLADFSVMLFNWTG